MANSPHSSLTNSVNAHQVATNLLLLSCAFLFIGCGENNSNRLTSNDVPGSSESANKAPAVVPSPAQASVRLGDLPFQLVEVPASITGIDFVHVSGNSKEKPFPAANGSGAGAVDYDGDGLPDLYFATGISFPIGGGNPDIPSSRMYRNRGGFRFQETTQTSGLMTTTYCVAIAVGDYDSDGFSDLYVTCFGDNLLFRNQGDGTFETVPITFGGNFSTSAAFADFDLDGLLDIYVCNYGQWTYEANPFCGDRARDVRIFCSPKSLEAEADRLLHNEGNGTFRDITQEAGLEAVPGRAQGVLATDVDLDGRTDLYIGNDIHPNFLFMNQADGVFRDSSEFSGTAYDSQGHMQASMGVAGADVDRDRKWDLFVTNFEGEYNALYLQNTPEDFHDATMTQGLAAESKPWVGWGAAFVDLDLDGWKDLIVTNGHVDDNLADLGRSAPYEQPALVWKNKNGRFQFLGDAAGTYFSKSHPGRSLVTADLDNDGDWDIVITHQDQSPGILRNDRVSPNEQSESLSLRLVGKKSNRDAIGTIVDVDSSIAPRVEQIQSGGSYLASSDLRLVIAVEHKQIGSLKISWPSGQQSVITELQPGGEYTVIEPEENHSAIAFPQKSSQLGVPQ